MKQQTAINLTLAMGGTLLLGVLVGINTITLRDWIFVCVGIWCVTAGHFATQILSDKTK